MTKSLLGRDVLWLDLETFSHLDLRKVGKINYCKHPTTDLSIFAGAYGDGLPFVTEHINDKLRAKLEDPKILKVSWNIGFDQCILQRTLGINTPANQWLDAMALAASLSLPLALDKCCDAMGLDEDDRKYADGRRLIQLFSRPHSGKRNDKHSHPDDWQSWLTYGMQDVLSMRMIIDLLRPYLRHTFTANELNIFRTDWAINHRGVPIDLEYCRNVIEINNEFTTKRYAQGQKLTGLDNPTSPPQLKAWLKEQGHEVENLRKENILPMSKDPAIPPHIREALAIRLELGKTSVAKFQGFLDRTDPDTGRLLDVLQYYGAHTGRWAGRGVQLHNLPQGVLRGGVDQVLAELSAIMQLVEAGDYATLRMLYGNLGMALSSTIRGTIKAPDGKLLCCVDYSSIETAVIAWLSGCSRLLELFAKGLDPYKDFASILFDKPYDAITKSERNFAKPAVLGAVFGLGATGYMNYARNFGQEVDEAQAQHIITTFRDTYYEVRRWHFQLREACENAMQGLPGFDHDAGPHVQFHRDDDRFLFLRLPSGRSLAYPVAELKEEETQWGRRNQFTYCTLQDYQWMRVKSHPGKLAENVTQAVARDLLADALVALENEGYNTILHVHDEIVTLVDTHAARSEQDRIERIMTQRPAWGKDIPIEVEGFLTPRYIKQ